MSATEISSPRGLSRLRSLVDNGVFLFSALLVAVIVGLALFAPWISRLDPAQMSVTDRLQAPSITHFFGTDQFGRDAFTRVIYGGRTSLKVALTAVTTAVAIGGLIGIIMVLYGGWFEAILLRVLDMLIAFPSLLLALFLVAVLGPELTNLIIAISLTRVPYFARLTRAEVASIKARPFIIAARTLGASQVFVVVHHILPNVIPLLIIFGTTDLALAVIAESSLSYLGLGAQPPTASWGRMLTESRGVMDQAPWLAIFPGLFVMMLVIGFNLLGDSLRDIFDPRLRGRN